VLTKTPPAPDAAPSSDTVYIAGRRIKEKGQPPSGGCSEADKARRPIHSPPPGDRRVIVGEDLYEGDCVLVR
jgi:hypothetical protein